MSTVSIACQTAAKWSVSKNGKEEEAPREAIWIMNASLRPIFVADYACALAFFGGSLSVKDLSQLVGFGDHALLWASHGQAMVGEAQHLFLALRNTLTIGTKWFECVVCPCGKRDSKAPHIWAQKKAKFAWSLKLLPAACALCTFGNLARHGAHTVEQSRVEKLEGEVQLLTNGSGLKKSKAKAKEAIAPLTVMPANSPIAGPSMPKKEAAKPLRK
ncbi:hypothetical protein PHLGIDRAFT_16813 [Phlebiopsis gigantea 11061_1 CR5-6]|uniref:Uncharacterized protein n=1 Tax=Phlebiopsis gigantea (strain 11061_1 CR5-6) TaxID=745531 RepID=A0A0C3RQF4_PHLG1|nr:hypothetical protein PHLGIDRAFT_16813 [Phlebiopsis gigantea 11061_1 CR5-6]